RFPTTICLFTPATSIELFLRTSAPPNPPPEAVAFLPASSALPFSPPRSASDQGRPPQETASWSEGQRCVVSVAVIRPLPLALGRLHHPLLRRFRDLRHRLGRTPSRLGTLEGSDLCLEYPE